MSEDAPKPAGHRRRLREKFIKSGFSGFHDYEIVELLLSLGTPRRDCKQPAKEAIARFKSLRAVLEADETELKEIKGIGPHNVFGIRLAREVARELLKAKVIEQPTYRSSQEVFDYLYLSMRDLKKEVFKVIFLNSQNQILDIEDVSLGTVNSSSVYAREVIESAIRQSAVSLIFVHNHPAGNPEPSQADRDLTRELLYAAKVMQLAVFDHIIIGDNRYFSFSAAGLIEEYESDYLNLKRTGTVEARRRLDNVRKSVKLKPHRA